MNTKPLLSLTLSALVTLLSTGCEKNVLQSTRDTALMNIRGNVTVMSQKDYTATQDEQGNFKFGKQLGSSEYRFNSDGMLTSEKHYDAAGEMESDSQLNYAINAKETVMTTAEGSVSTSRNLDAGTMEQTFRNSEGAIEKTVRLKIDKKALPLEAIVSDPSGQVVAETTWERDVYGNVTSVVHKENGTVVYRKTFVPNKMGDPTQEVEANATDTIATRSYLYNYDKKGNWTRRIIRHMEKGAKDAHHTVSERSYSYN